MWGNGEFMLSQELPEEVEIAMEIQRGVDLEGSEDVKEIMGSWGINARTGQYVLPDVLHDCSVVIEVAQEDWSEGISEMWDREII